LLPRQAEVVVEVRNVLATIRRVTADNVSQQANWEKLSQVSERRLGLMEQAIELKRSGKADWGVAGLDEPGDVGCGGRY